MKIFKLTCIPVFCLFVCPCIGFGQNSGTGKLEVDKVVFRPAQWEQEKVRELAHEMKDDLRKSVAKRRSKRNKGKKLKDVIGEDFVPL